MPLHTSRGITIASAVVVGGITQPSGLFVYYTLDDANTTTTTASDTNPNSFGPHDSTLNNSPASITGQIGQGRTFANPSAKYGNSASFQAPQTALSVCTWINPITINALEMIACQSDGTGANTAWEFFQNSDGTLLVRIRNNVDWIGRSTTTAITTGSWQHVAVTWSGGTTAAAIKIYKNAAQIDNADSNNGTFTAINTVSTPLGIANEGTNFVLDSSLDDFRLYNRELSSSDITAIYNAGLAGNP